jgi:FtsZ-binding cell division protein ZapB
METFDAGLMAVGLKPDVSEELVRTVTDRLVENVQILLVENVTRQLLEYRELMNTHLALQRDYMSQQNQFQGLIDQHQQLSSDHEALQHRSGSIRNLLKTVLSRIWGKICRAL